MHQITENASSNVSATFRSQLQTDNSSCSRRIEGNLHTILTAAKRKKESKEKGKKAMKRLGYVSCVCVCGVENSKRLEEDIKASGLSRICHHCVIHHPVTTAFQLQEFTIMQSCEKIPLATALSLLLLLLITFCSANDNSSKPGDKSARQQTSLYGSCGHSGCFCAPGIPGIPGSPGPAGTAGVAGSPGNHGPEGPMGPRGNKGDEGAHGRQGPPGPKGIKGPAGAAGPAGNKGEAGPRGKQGLPGLKGPQGPSGSAGSHGNKGDTGARGSQGPPGPKGAPGSFGRTWKQCVFKNLDDNRDSGLIKECIFKKMSDNTALRVFWSGNLRIANCDNCCRRWYFTFNGAECSAPAAIDGIVYMRYGTGSRYKNLHRPRHIEGICDKIHKGTVRVGFWVGNCASYGSADANTGWNSVSRIYVEEVPPPQS